MLTKKEKEQITKKAFETISMIFTKNKIRPSQELWDVAIDAYQAGVRDYTKYIKEINREK